MTQKRSGCSSSIVIVLTAIGMLLAADSRPVLSQVQVVSNLPDLRTTASTLRHRAAPDECFAFLAVPSPLPKFTDPALCGTYGTNPPALPKVNQSYIWGLTHTGDHLWFGTLANGNCFTPLGLNELVPTPYQTDSWVCEFAASPYYPTPYPSPLIGDARPPRVYRYSKSTQALEEMTPRYPIYITPNNPEGIIPLLSVTRGLRSATAFNGLVLLAGPSLDPRGGVSLFAWDETTGAYLGHRVMTGYINIRDFVNVDGILYTAAGLNICTINPPSCGTGVNGGRILRFVPSKIPGCTFVAPSSPYIPVQPCFLLNGGAPGSPVPPTEVGILESVGASLTAHNGRIYTLTWPEGNLSNTVSTLYMSPAVPPGGLTGAHAQQWTRVWRASNYEPDPLIVQSYAGGALASFDGYLFWGTMHLPTQAFALLAKTYPPSTPEEAALALSGTMRATAFFRGKDLDTPNPQIDLLYGNERLPVFIPPKGSTPGRWTLEMNKTGKKSMWGPSGFGNIWNAYTWSAKVWDNRLWIGTLDWGLQAQQSLTIRPPATPVSTFFPQEANNPRFGADLFYFTSASTPAFPETINGFGNPTTYGFRTQLVSSGSLFLGTANPMNLLTDPADPLGLGGLGGWELHEVTATASNTPAGTNVTVALPNGGSVTYCRVTRAGTTFGSTVKNPYGAKTPVDPLLAGFDLDGPDTPPGLLRQPSSLFVLWSSALWGQDCPASSLARVRLPVPAGVLSPRLFEMRWTGGEFVWRDITTSVQPAARTIEGGLSSSYIGVLSVAGIETGR